MTFWGNCPVCYREVGRTRWGRIAAHRDSIARDMCPASQEPFDITIEPDEPSQSRRTA